MKDNNKRIIPSIVLIALGVLVLIFGFSNLKSTSNKENVNDKLATGEKAKGIMILIEYKDMLGLSNFVNELQERDMHGLLMVTPEFVQANCEAVKEVIKHDVEIVASNIGAPLWDMPYEEQKSRIIEMKEGIESCTNVPIRIISSTYMASDATTIKVAQELGIPYVTARGTTGSKATVYEVEDYPGVKIMSISNIPMVQYKYGSLCDYSYFERNGGPEDMIPELKRSLEPLSSKEIARYGKHHKITPVSHTNIGGYLKPWMDMWTSFWDETKNDVKWVDLDEFMAEPDWKLPLWQIPVNKNNPYTPEKIRPVVDYSDIEKIANPCLVQDIGNPDRETDIPLELEEKFSVGDKIMMFHNGKGPMCLEAMEFIKTLDYPVEEYIEGQEAYNREFNRVREEFSSSEGIHPLFGYYPIIFVKDRAYSGFNESVERGILNAIK